MEEGSGMPEMTQICLGAASPEKTAGSQVTKVFPLELLKHLCALTLTVPGSFQAHPVTGAWHQGRDWLLTPCKKVQLQVLHPTKTLWVFVVFKFASKSSPGQGQLIVHVFLRPHCFLLSVLLQLSGERRPGYGVRRPEFHHGFAVQNSMLFH